MMYEVNNVSDYAFNYKYVVLNRVEGEFWFFSAWNDLQKATEQARMLTDGYVVESEKVIKLW